MKDNILIYQNEKGSIELRADIEKDTIWATQDQIAELFKVSRPNITMHLQSIFETKELIENSVSKDFLLTAQDSKKYKVKHYNLDAIIAVGYRVNSKKATQFRIWATGVLREYLKGGFSLNRYKLDRSPSALMDLYTTMAGIESKGLGGKLRGKVTFKMTQDFES